MNVIITATFKCQLLFNTMIHSLSIMSEHIPQEASHIDQENVIGTASNEPPNSKEPPIVSGCQDNKPQQIHQSSNLNLQMTDEQQRFKVQQKVKQWIKCQMRKVIRQEVLEKVQPKIRWQYQRRINEIFDVTKKMMSTHLHNWSLISEKYQGNMSKATQQLMEQIQPQITESKEEKQQDIALDSRGNSPDSERSFDSKRSRNGKNRSDSSDSSNSSGSSDTKIGRSYKSIQKYVSIGIYGALMYYHNQLVRTGRLISRP